MKGLSRCSIHHIPPQCPLQPWFSFSKIHICPVPSAWHRQTPLQSFWMLDNRLRKFPDQRHWNLEVFQWRSIQLRMSAQPALQILLQICCVDENVLIWVALYGHFPKPCSLFSSGLFILLIKLAQSLKIKDVFLRNLNVELFLTHFTKSFGENGRALSAELVASVKLIERRKS